jgi:hypothetical protein
MAGSDDEFSSADEGAVGGGAAAPVAGEKRKVPKKTKAALVWNSTGCPMR